MLPVPLLLLLLLPAAGLAVNPRPVVYEITEEEVSGTFVGNLPLDAALSRIFSRTVLRDLNYSFLTKSAHLDHFNLDRTSGRLSINKPIDRDVICRGQWRCDISLDVAVQPVQHFQVIKVTLRVLDLNDNAPHFPSNGSPFRISEATTPGVLFPIPTAHDPDSPTNGVKRYELLSRESSSAAAAAAAAAAPGATFRLETRNSSDGTIDLQLYLTEHLDRERHSEYELVVRAYDGGSPPRTGDLVVRISLTDINDNTPKFKNRTYGVRVPEDIPPHQLVVQVKATDRDAGANGLVRYSFTDKTQKMYGNVLKIDPRNGNITFRHSHLDVQRKVTYSLSVNAQDEGPDSLPTTAKVVIHLIDVNDNAPIIKINNFEREDYALVPENVNAPYFVAHVSVYDDDRGENGRFSCSLDPPNHFTLEQLYDTEFKVMTKETFDREEQAAYQTLIVCMDDGSPPKKSVALLKVNVGDANDNAPVFDKRAYFASVEENSIDRKNPLLAVSASDEDADMNGLVRYELEESARKDFQIDSNGGLWPRKVFDREKEDTMEFLVFARDGATESKRTSSAEVIITVTDVDDSGPRFTHRKNLFDVDENMPPLTEVGKVIAYDHDRPPNNRFEYVLGTAHSHLFRIDNATGYLSTLRPLDHERKNMYNLTVHVVSLTRRAGNDTTVALVHVNDVNDNSPNFVFPSHSNHAVQVSSHAPIDAVVAKVHAVDADFGVNARVTYGINEGNEGGEFEVNPQTGELVVKGDLSFGPDSADSERARHTAAAARDGRELTRQYRLTMLAKDGGNSVSVQQLVVTVNSSIAWVNAVPGPQPTQSLFDLNNSSLTVILAVIASTLVLVILLVLAIVCVKRRRRSLRDCCCCCFCCCFPVVYGRKKQTASSCGGENGKQHGPHVQIETRDMQLVPQRGAHVRNNAVENMAMKLPPDYDDDRVSVTNSAVDAPHKVTMDHLALQSTGEKDSDSGCCADMSNFDTSLGEDGDARGGHVMKMKCYHSLGPRRPQHAVLNATLNGSATTSTRLQSSFSDWLSTESQQLRQNGHVYRVQADANKLKAVRFNEQSRLPLNASAAAAAAAAMDDCELPLPPDPNIIRMDGKWQDGSLV